MSWRDGGGNASKRLRHGNVGRTDVAVRCHVEAHVDFAAGDSDAIHHQRVKTQTS